VLVDTFGTEAIFGAPDRGARPRALRLRPAASSAISPASADLREDGRVRIRREDGDFTWSGPDRADARRAAAGLAEARRLRRLSASNIVHDPPLLSTRLKSGSLVEATAGVVGFALRLTAGNRRCGVGDERVGQTASRLPRPRAIRCDADRQLGTSGRDESVAGVVLGKEPYQLLHRVVVLFGRSRPSLRVAPTAQIAGDFGSAKHRLEAAVAAVTPRRCLVQHRLEEVEVGRGRGPDD